MLAPPSSAEPIPTFAARLRPTLPRAAGRGLLVALLLAAISASACTVRPASSFGRTGVTATDGIARTIGERSRQAQGNTFDH